MVSSEDDRFMNKRVWKSYVFHDDKCWFVSTIERWYDTAIGGTIGLETLVWEYDWEKNERGPQVFHCGGLDEHHAICRCLHGFGVVPSGDDDDRYTRFLGRDGQ